MNMNILIILWYALVNGTSTIFSKITLKSNTFLINFKLYVSAECNNQKRITGEFKIHGDSIFAGLIDFIATYSGFL